MRLATIRVQHPRSVSERKDGRLVVVGKDSETAALVPAERYPNLISALEEWHTAEPFLKEISDALAAGKWNAAMQITDSDFMAPLPRSYGWLDGSAFIQHVILVRKARNAELPPDLYTVPLMYQGISDNLMGPFDDIPLIDPAFGLDFEGEVAIVTDQVPLGTKAKDAAAHIKLLMLMNDVSLRELIPREVNTGFGFIQGKPTSAFSQFAITPDELKDRWLDGRVHLEYITKLNGVLFGRPNAAEMHFSFCDLIQHAARTRTLSPGTIIGSGTISNKDESVGSSCLAEKRMLEKIQSGEIRTPFMKVGDTVEMQMLTEGSSLFGEISQKVVQFQEP